MAKPKHAIVPDSMQGMMEILMYGVDHGYLCICGTFLKCPEDVTEDEAYEAHVQQVYEDKQTDELIQKMREHVHYYKVYNSEYYRRNPSQTARSYTVTDIRLLLNRLDSLTKE